MWEQIRANHRRSTLLIIGMALALVALGAAGGAAYAGRQGYIAGIGFALIVFGVQLAVYFAAADSVLLAGTNAREITHQDSPQLFNIVEEMKVAAGLTFMPRVCIIDDPAPNAFAVGGKPTNSAVCVTTGLLHRLNRDELQGVIAHEIGHLKNQDVRFMSLAAILLGSIVMLSEIFTRSMRFGSRSRTRSSSRGGGQAQFALLIIAILLAILAPILAQLLYFACSRKREYLADASGALFTRYPEGLASALEKISATHSAPEFANKVTAPMFIINPLAAAGQSFSLLSTHPPTVERVRILRSMTGASLAAYDQAFRSTTGRSVLKADDTPVAIRAASATGPIESRRDVREIASRAEGYIAIPCRCGACINIPPGYARDTIRCLRCGDQLSIPTAVQKPEPQTLQYRRAGTAWESFRCECGRTVQLSPAFQAPAVRCQNCGRTIEVL